MRGGDGKPGKEMGEKKGSEIKECLILVDHPTRVALCVVCVLRLCVCEL